MATNKTINHIRCAHWEKASLALRAKALGFSRYCTRYVSGEKLRILNGLCWLTLVLLLLSAIEVVYLSLITGHHFSWVKWLIYIMGAILTLTLLRGNSSAKIIPTLTLFWCLGFIVYSVYEQYLFFFSSSPKHLVIAATFIAILTTPLLIRSALKVKQ
ncbi:hypothetical protein [Aliiglaciecola litoralis]|uniref:hypothetical protein n=1 Tax=Aliiglaciecola litoralis TaxID=582857 RepID=UPI0031D364D1